MQIRDDRPRRQPPARWALAVVEPASTSSSPAYCDLGMGPQHVTLPHQVPSSRDLIEPWKLRVSRTVRGMAAKKQTETTIDKLEQFALSLPEAWADSPWGDRVVKVAKKIFVFLELADSERPGHDGQAARVA